MKDKKLLVNEEVEAQVVREGLERAIGAPIAPVAGMKLARTRASTAVMKSTIVCLLSASLLVACGAAPRASEPIASSTTAGAEAAYEPLNRWVLVEVGSAMIARTQASTGAAWDLDPAAADAAEREQISAFADIANLILPGAGSVVSVLSALGAPPPPREASPTLPDPRYRIALARGATTREVSSHIEFNTAAPIWRDEYWINLDDLEGEGLRITVEDDDGSEADHTGIGEVTVPRDVLELVAGDFAPRDLALSHGDLEQLRVHLSAPVGALPTQHNVSLGFSEGLVATGIRAPMGSIISVTVTGGGEVTNGWCGPPYVETEGVSGGRCREHNLEAFVGSAHAVPVMVWGVGYATRGVDLGAPTGTCQSLLSRGPGEIVVGINDDDLGNDAGVFEFHIEVAPPYANGAPGSERWPCDDTE